MSNRFLGVLAAMTMTLSLQAEDKAAPKQHKYGYRLQQVSTFGGPNSSFATGPDNFFEKYFNSRGAMVGLADTSAADPLSPYCFYVDCLVTSGFTFDKKGKQADLGALPGAGTSSVAYGLNDHGLVVGVSSTGNFDPVTGFPETHAVVWKDGSIVDLGTAGGASSQALAVNEEGVVVGVTSNDVPDTYSGALGPCTGWNCWTVSTQQRAFRWKNGTTEDLGTLGGNDAVAYFINDHGQIAGVSFTNATPSATLGIPTQDPFLWHNGKMIDLGGLGGTFSAVSGLNRHGQVSGLSNLPGDATWHPFLWDEGKMNDLGTLGGDSGFAYSLSNSGDVTGQAQTTGNAAQHAFFWHQGTMTDLGTLLPASAGTSMGYAVNSRGQVVGFASSADSSGLSAFFWEDGQMMDLNALVVNPPASGLHLIYAYAIADSGEVLAFGLLPSGAQAVALLTRVEE